MAKAPTPNGQYPSNVVRFAQRLHEENGWSINKIRNALIARGFKPAHTTILCWVDEDYREARYEHHRIGGVGGQKRLHTWNRRFKRMRELREIVGLSYRDIAALMSHEYRDLELSEAQVRYALQGKTSPRTARRMLAPKQEATA